MAQNNGLIIGIIALLVIGGVAWYFLNAPGAVSTDNLSPTAFAQQNNSVLQAAQATLTPQGTITLSELFNMEDSQLRQLESLTNNSPPNESIRSFNTIIRLTAQAAIKEHELRAIATQISQIQSDAYCAQLSLFIARDQAGSEMIQLLKQGKQAIMQFSTNYPELATAYGLASEEYDYSAAEAAQSEREQTTQSLQASCQGAN